MSARDVLVTGGSGFVGKAWLRRLLADPEVRVHALLRAPADPARLELPADTCPRVHVIPGDLGRDLLGLPEASLARLREADALEVWHLAAATDLDPAAGEATLRSNILGAIHLLRLLAALPVRCLNLVSTIGVAGTRAPPERVPEALLSRGRFHGPYEESKHWAELLVARSGLPHRIVRLPIVVGDPGTGASDDKTIYGLFAALCWARRELRELAAAPRVRVQADPRATKNLLCVDDIVAALAEIRARGPVDRVYNLVNPRPTLAAEILAACAELTELTIAADPDLDPAGLEAPERDLHDALRPLRPYMLSSTPEFAREHAVAAGAPTPRAVDGPLLRTLLRAFVARRPGLLGP